MSDPNSGLVHIVRRSLLWVRLLSIAGFVSVGLAALLCIVGPGREYEVLIACVLFMVFSFVPSLHLYKTSRRMSIFVAQGHTVQLEAVLEAERKFWRFVGVTALVWLICAAIAVVGMVAGL